MPAQRKPEGQRLRRNLPVVAAFLPMEGYQGPIPEWPLAEPPTAVETERWEKLWRTPMAAQWVRMHIDTLVARYVLVAVQAEDKYQKVSMATTNLTAEARHLEKVLGIGPDALRLLQWEIAVDELEEARAPVPVASRRRLKAVDPDVG